MELQYLRGGCSFCLCKQQQLQENDLPSDDLNELDNQFIRQSRVGQSEQDANGNKVKSNIHVSGHLRIFEHLVVQIVI